MGRSPRRSNSPMSTAPPRRPLLLKVLLGAAALIAAVNVGVYVYSLTLPDTWFASAQVEVLAPPETVYQLAATPARWPEWSPWNTTADPTLEFATSGPEIGEDSSIHWVGRNTGTGRLTIYDVLSRESSSYRVICFRLSLQGQPFIKAGHIEIEQTAAGVTTVSLDAGGDLNDTLSRLFGSRLEAAVNADFQAALQRLKVLAEKDHSAP